MAGSLRFEVQPLRMPMRVAFKQASFTRTRGDAVWVEVRRGDHVGLGEGCPRPYVTGETSEGAVAWIEEGRSSWATELGSLDALKAFVASHRPQIDQNPAAWCAVESAVLDLLAREAGMSVEALLGLGDGPHAFAYTAVLGDVTGKALDALVGRYLGLGFCDLKVKTGADAERDRGKLARIEELAGEAGVDQLRVRLDANNVWGDDLAAARRHLEAQPPLFVAVEEPFAARTIEAQSALAAALRTQIILDESMCHLDDLERYVDRPGPWIANVKVSKCGGLLRTLELVAALRKAGLPIVIGAQVGETSVLTRLGMIAARAAGPALWAHEGGFGLNVLAADAVTPVLQFGAGGRLDLATAGLGASGWGLDRVEGPLPSTPAEQPHG